MVEFPGGVASPPSRGAGVLLGIDLAENGVAWRVQKARERFSRKAVCQRTDQPRKFQRQAAAQFDGFDLNVRPVIFFLHAPVVVLDNSKKRKDSVMLWR